MYIYMTFTNDRWLHWNLLVIIWLNFRYLRIAKKWRAFFGAFLCPSNILPQLEQRYLISIIDSGVFNFDNFKSINMDGSQNESANCYIWHFHWNIVGTIYDRKLQIVLQTYIPKRLHYLYYLSWQYWFSFISIFNWRWSWYSHSYSVMEGNIFNLYFMLFYTS